MPTLDATTLARIRRDIADKTEPYAFSDVELEDNYDRCDGVYYPTLVLTIEQLVADAAKLYNYTSGYTKQEQEKVFDHLFRIRDMFLEKSGSTNASIVGLSIVPTKHKAQPLESLSMAAIRKINGN